MMRHSYRPYPQDKSHMCAFYGLKNTFGTQWKRPRSFPIRNRFGCDPWLIWSKLSIMQCNREDSFVRMHPWTSRIAFILRPGFFNRPQFRWRRRIISYREPIWKPNRISYSIKQITKTFPTLQWYSSHSGTSRERRDISNDGSPYSKYTNLSKFPRILRARVNTL